MKRTALSLALLLGTAALGHADTYTFRDILKPNGKERSMAQKRADGRRCGATRDAFPTNDTERFTACMRGRGWVIGHIDYAPPSDEDVPDPDDQTIVHFDDQHRDANGRWRGNGVLQADTQRCSGYGRLDYESRPFIRCMASAGWRYKSTHRATRRHYDNDDNTPPPDTSANVPLPPIPDLPPPMQYDVITGQPLP